MCKLQVVSAGIESESLGAFQERGEGQGLGESKCFLILCILVVVLRQPLSVGKGESGLQNPSPSITEQRQGQSQEQKRNSHLRSSPGLTLMSVERMPPSPFAKLSDVQRSWERHWGWALSLPSVTMPHYPQIMPGGSPPPSWSAAWPEPLSVESVMETRRAVPEPAHSVGLARLWLHRSCMSQPVSLREGFYYWGYLGAAGMFLAPRFPEARGAGGPLCLPAGVTWVFQHRGCSACFLLQLASRTGGAESTGWGSKSQAQIVPNWKGQVWKVCPVP